MNWLIGLMLLLMGDSNQQVDLDITTTEPTQAELDTATEVVAPDIGEKEPGWSVIDHVGRYVSSPLLRLR